MKYLLIAVSLILLSSPAIAQQRPLLLDVPDLELLDEVDSDGDLGAIAITAEVAGVAGIGPEEHAGAGSVARLRLSGRLSPSPYHGVLVDSHLFAPIYLSGADASAPDGRHHVSAHVGTEVDEGDQGVAFTVDYVATHMGGPGLQPEPAMSGLPGFDQRLEAGLWLLMGMGSQAAWAMPVEYRLDRTTYDESELVAGESVSDFTTHGVSTGFGIRLFTGEVASTWLQIARFGYSTTSFDDIDRTIDGFDFHIGPEAAPVLRLDDGFYLAFGYHAGGSWRWDAPRRRQMGMFTGGAQVALHIGDEDSTRFGFGGSFNRTAGFTPNGEELVARHRVEALLEVEGARGVGFSHRAGYDWTAHPEVETEGQVLPDPRGTHTLQTEWYMPIGPLDLGAYHRAALYPVEHLVDPWDQRREWSQEVGGFLRLQTDFSID